MLKLRSWLGRNWPVVGLCSFFILGIAGAVFFWPDQYAKPENGGKGNAQTEATQDRATVVVADYTEVLAWFTGVLAVVAVVGGCFTWSQIRLGRDEFNATHRPQIRIRNVVVNAPDPKNPHSSPFDPHHLIDGQIYISNFGNGWAIIKEAHCEVRITDQPLPMKRPYEGRAGNFSGSVKIPAGGSCPLTFQSDRQVGVRQSDWINTYGHGDDVYVLGWVAYEDAAGVKRRMAFCRVYDASLRRFVRVDNSDYDHEE